MFAFEDSHGRKWSLWLTIGNVRRIKNETSIDLMAIDQGKPPLIERLVTDPYTLVDTILAVISPQIAEARLSPQDVMDSMDANHAKAAKDAFFESLTDFFQQWGWTDKLSALNQVLKLGELAKTKAVETLASVDLERLLSDQTNKARAQLGLPTVGTPSTVPQA